MPRKKGALSLKEQDFIRDNIDRHSAADIAVRLNRTEATIKKYCSENNLTYKGMSDDVYDDTLIRAKLESKPFWGEIKAQFDDEDLEFFVAMWISIMKQFKENLLPSEETQLVTLISLHILANDVLHNRQQAKIQLNAMEDRLNAEYNVSEELRDADIIMRLEQELSMLRNSMSSFSTEYTKLLDRIEKNQKELRADRAARVKVVEDSKSSFAGFVKHLKDDDFRKKLGEELEINKLAQEAAIKRLSEYHTYEDGQVDQPWLTTDTAKD